MQSLKLRCFIL